MDLAQIVEDLAKPENMQSYSFAEVRDKVRKCIAAGMVITVHLATEISNKFAHWAGFDFVGTHRDEDSCEKYFIIVFPVRPGCDSDMRGDSDGEGVRLPRRIIHSRPARRSIT